MKFTDLGDKGPDFIREMDSQGYRGSRDSVEDDAGKKEYHGKVAKPSDVVKQGAKALDNAFNHKEDSMKKGVDEAWKDEADDYSEWSNYVKEKLSKASPEQRLGLAKQLSQLEVKHFGSTVPGTFNRETGKPQAGLGLTDTVRNALKYFNAEQTGIRQYNDQDLPSGTFGTQFGSVTIDGMENATPAELALMAKAVRAGPDYAKAAGRIYRETGTITQQDLDDIRQGFERNAEKFAASIGAQMDNSHRSEQPTALAQASLANRDHSMSEGTASAVDAKGRTQQQWVQLVKQKYPTAKIAQAKMINGPVIAYLDDGRKLYWKKVEQQPVTEGSEDMTPNWAKYVLDQIYNSNGSVTMTDLFDENIPGLHAMFMATAQEHRLDPEEDFQDVEHEVLLKLEHIVNGGHGLDEASLAQMRDYFNQADSDSVKVDRNYDAPSKKQNPLGVPPEIQALVNKMYHAGKISPQEFEVLRKFQQKTKINVGIREADKNPYAIGMASAMKSTGDKPPLKKSTINKAHKIARAIEKGE